MNTFSHMSHVVLLANGTLPHHPRALRFLQTAEVLICCDGALAKARQLGREPDFVVGDGDSLSSADQRALGDRLVLVAEQETNDLAKAFRFAVETYSTACTITLLGATGLREDHALGNIFRLLDFTGTVPGTTLVTDDGTFEVVRTERTFTCQPGESLSIFAPLPQTRVSSTGLVWPLDGVDLTPLWSGTLNKTQGEFFTLRPSHPILIYRPHPTTV